MLRGLRGGSANGEAPFQIGIDWSGQFNVRQLARGAFRSTNLTPSGKRHDVIISDKIDLSGFARWRAGKRWERVGNSRAGRPSLPNWTRDGAATREMRRETTETEQNQGSFCNAIPTELGPRRATTGKCGRIPIDDYHKSASEGEGACSRTSAGRSHLPLRGKLGWMTPRPGQKKTGKRNASTGGSCSQAGAPILFRATLFRTKPFLVDRRLRATCWQPTKSVLRARQRSLTCDRDPTQQSNASI
jgi:hypothetical protein